MNELPCVNLKDFISGDSKRFDDITAGDYLNQRLEELGLIKI